MSLSNRFAADRAEMQKSARTRARREADRCRDERRWAEAAALYRKHLDKHPRDFAIWVQAANCLKEAGAFEESYAAYRQAIALNDSDADAFLLFGHLVKMMGKREEAIEAFRATLARQPQNSSMVRELEALGASVEVAPFAPPAQAVASGRSPTVPTRSLFDRLHVRGARVRKSARTPGRQEADRCRDEKRWAEAAILYQKHLDKHPRDFAIWVQAANCLKEAGAFEESYAAYRRAIGLNDGDADAFLLFGQLQKMMGKREEAIATFRASLARQPGNRSVLRELEVLGAGVKAAPAVAVAPAADVEQVLGTIDQQLRRLTESWTSPAVNAEISAPSSAGPGGPPVTLTKPERPAIFLLVDSTIGDDAEAAELFRPLATALVDQGEEILFVCWSTAAKALQLASRSELDRIGLRDLADRSRGCRGDHAPTTTVGSTSCGEDDWLLVADFVRDGTGGADLIAMDLIMEAKRLGLRSAFIFQGAEPLRLKKDGGRVADAYERYMQALLLADAIMPVSTVATNDLTAFFVQHERATSQPLIRKIFAPGQTREASKMPWSDYVRRIRGVLTDANLSMQNLAALYYCVDPAASPVSPTAEFASRLAHALSDRGLALVPAAWDARGQQLIPSDIQFGKTSHSGAPIPWADWISPDDDNAPRWVLQPSRIGASQLSGLTAFARRHGLRTAALLHEAAVSAPGPGLAHPFEQDRELFECLASFDKVYGVSEHRFDAFYRFLLSLREKVGSAEHRFKALSSPTEIPGQSRRVAPKRAASGAVRIFVATPLGGSPHDAMFLHAAAEAAKCSPNQLIFTMTGVQADLQPSDAADLDAKTASIPEAIWEKEADGDRLLALAESADFVVLSVFDAELHSKIAQSLWRGVPCLVLEPAAASPRMEPIPGVLVAETQRQSELTDAILKLCDPEWRRQLANEAIARPVRSWNEYAKDLVADLAADRLSDSLRPIEAQVRGDVYATLFNLRRRPKLSLCISTYNRAGWLEVNLTNIFAQRQEPLAELEILVVDNASTDNTSSAVEPFLSRPDFRYVRNPKNVGMLGNLAVTAQAARGEYIWILGDDDLTLPGAIERVLEILNERPTLGLIYVNYGYTAEADPANVGDLETFLGAYNTLELACEDEFAPVKAIAAKTENFFGAIYSHVYRRDHALRSYCQDTSGRIFSTMRSCVPTTYYVLNYMMDEPAYWIGQPLLMANSNVSWQDYGALLELEHLPAAWDLAERLGADPAEVDRRRANRMWLVEMMWKGLFEIDTVGNSAYFSAARAVMRLKHLKEFEQRLDELRSAYELARALGHPAASMPTEELFSAFQAH